MTTVQNFDQHLLCEFRRSSLYFLVKEIWREREFIGESRYWYSKITNVLSSWATRLAVPGRCIPPSRNAIYMVLFYFLWYYMLPTVSRQFPKKNERSQSEIHQRQNRTRMRWSVYREEPEKRNTGTSLWCQNRMENFKNRFHKNTRKNLHGTDRGVHFPRSEQEGRIWDWIYNQLYGNLDM